MQTIKRLKYFVIFDVVYVYTENTDRIANAGNVNRNEIKIAINELATPRDTLIIAEQKNPLSFFDDRQIRVCVTVGNFYYCSCYKMRGRTLPTHRILTSTQEIVHDGSNDFIGA